MPTTSTSTRYAPLALTVDLEEDEAIPDTYVELRQNSPPSPRLKNPGQKKCFTTEESATETRSEKFGLKSLLPLNSILPNSAYVSTKINTNPNTRVF